MTPMSVQKFEQQSSSEAQSKMLRGLIFDLDDTLYAAKTAYRVAEAQTMEWLRGTLAIEYSCEDLSRIFKLVRAEVKHRLPHHHTSAHHRVLYWKALLERVLECPGPELILKVQEHYSQVLHEEVKRQMLQQTLVLKRLRNLPQKKAVLTDEVAWTQLGKLSCIDPRGEIFSHCLTSEELGEEKPSARGFKELLRRLQCDADQVLMIGDDYQKDVVGAISQGIRAWWICAPHESTRYREGLVGQGSLEQAVEWIEKSSQTRAVTLSQNPTTQETRR